MTTWTCCDPNGVTFCVGCGEDIKHGRTLPHVAEHFPWHYTEFGVICACGLTRWRGETCPAEAGEA